MNRPRQPHLVHQQLDIFPNLALGRRVTEQIGGVIGRQDWNAAVIMQPPAKSADGLFVSNNVVAATAPKQQMKPG